MKISPLPVKIDVACGKEGQEDMEFNPLPMKISVGTGNEAKRTHCHGKSGFQWQMKTKGLGVQSAANEN